MRVWVGVVHAAVVVSCASRASATVACSGASCWRRPVHPQPGQTIAPNDRVIMATNGADPACNLPELRDLVGPSSFELFPDLGVEGSSMLPSSWSAFDVVSVRGGGPLPSDATIVVSDTWGLSCAAKPAGTCALACDGVEAPCCDMQTGETRELFRFTRGASPTSSRRARRRHSNPAIGNLRWISRASQRQTSSRSAGGDRRVISFSAGHGCELEISLARHGSEPSTPISRVISTSRPT